MGWPKVTYKWMVQHKVIPKREGRTKSPYLCEDVRLKPLPSEGSNTR